MSRELYNFTNIIYLIFSTLYFDELNCEKNITNENFDKNFQIQMNAELTELNRRNLGKISIVHQTNYPIAVVFELRGQYSLSIFQRNKRL